MKTDVITLLKDSLELAKKHAEMLPDCEIKDDIIFEIDTVIRKLEYKIY